MKKNNTRFKPLFIISLHRHFKQSIWSMYIVLGIYNICFRTCKSRIMFGMPWINQRILQSLWFQSLPWLSKSSSRILVKTWFWRVCFASKNQEPKSTRYLEYLRLAFISCLNEDCWSKLVLIFWFIFFLITFLIYYIKKIILSWKSNFLKCQLV